MGPFGELTLLVCETKLCRKVLRSFKQIVCYPAPVVRSNGRHHAPALFNDPTSKDLMSLDRRRHGLDRLKSHFVLGRAQINLVHEKRHNPGRPR